MVPRPHLAEPAQQAARIGITNPAQRENRRFPEKMD
jgi:hypothetical protein